MYVVIFLSVADVRPDFGKVSPIAYVGSRPAKRQVCVAVMPRSVKDLK